MSRVSLAAAALLAIAAGLAGAWFAARSPGPADAPMHARVLDTPRPVPAVAMTDHRGEPFTPERLHGHYSFVFFGFTHCPDVCPTTLQTLADVRQRLDDLPPAERPAVLLISVDPQRDTPEQLAGYVPHFDPEFTGIHVEASALPELARAFGAAYGYTPAGEDGYVVDHTASVFLVDAQGRIAAVFTTPHEAAAMARDYRAIVNERRRS
jgi:protein SCO1/2